MSKAIKHVFKSADECNAAIEAFFKGVTELREKLGISQVLLGVMANIEYEEGMAMGQTYLRLGDAFHDLPLAAYMLGELQADHRRMINLIAMGGEEAKRAGGRKPLGKLFRN